MKPNLLRWAVIALLAAMPLVARPQYAIVLDEDFEECTDGSLPPGWTLEHVTGTHRDWAVESGGSHPDGAYDGSGRRVALRNGTDMTMGFVTRLVTPPMDLSTLNLPVLCFAHAQAQWAGDFDVLRVYYRTSPDKEWTPLPAADYSREQIPLWRMDTVELSSTLGQRRYQIAFEGADRLGHGIVLDNIVVRSKPTCLQPANLFITEQQNTSVTLNFSSGIDSESFRVIISGKELTPEELEGGSEAILVDSVVPSENVLISGLQPNTAYFAYVRANCATEVSLWSEVFMFSTASTATVPFRETFDTEFSYSLQARRKAWTYYHSDGEFSPYINAKTYSYDLEEYSRDRTTGLFFTSESSATTPLKAGQLAYTATPYLDVEDISECQVTFYGKYKEPSLSKYSKRLIVGVMEKPDDYKTFVPVDTVELNGYTFFQDFIVPLYSYTGNGKYIALVSDFDEDNIFYLDDFRVDYISACAYPYDLRISIPSAEKISVTWDSHGASKGDILISEKEIDTASIDLTSPDVTLKQDADLSSPVTVDVKPQTDYWLCVRNKCTDAGVWSIPVKIHTPGKVTTLPDTITFEENEATYSPKEGINYAYLPVSMLTHDDMSNGQSCINSSLDYFLSRSPNVLRLMASAMNRTYVVLPSVDGLTDTRVTFWYYSMWEENIGTSFEVGMMSDAADTTTFKPLDTLTTTGMWQKAVIDIKDSKDGSFIAFRMDGSDDPNKTTYVGIDDILFSETPLCGDPADIKIVPGEITAKASWEANGATAWDVRVTASEVHPDSLTSETFSGIIFRADGLTDPSVTLTGLLPDSKDHFFYIRALCDGASWSGALKFTTECQAECRLPYTLNFEGIPNDTYDYFPVPCVYTEIHVGSEPWIFWPQLQNGPYATHRYNGAFVQFNSANSEMHDNYLALPPMDGTKEMAELQISMYVLSMSPEKVLAIGVMTDPEDLTTFDTVAVFRQEPTEIYEEVITTFSGYKGSGRHIALRTDGAFCVDEITVNVKDACAKVQKPKMRNVSDKTAIIGWIADVEKQWDLLVSRTPVEYDMLTSRFASPAEGMAVHTVDKNPCTVDGLIPNTEYYVYVRANCGNGVYGEWANGCAHFTTECVPWLVSDNKVESFDGYGIGEGVVPGCWTVGYSDEEEKEYFPYCTDEYRHSGSASLRFHSYIDNDAYAIMPRVDTEDIRKLQVSFWGSCAGNNSPKYENRLIVGIASSANDWSTFVPVDTVEGYGTEQYYTVQFSSYKGAVDGSLGQYIAFRSYFSKENYFYIDDVTVQPAHPCPAPQTIALDVLSDRSATFSWSGGSAPYTVVVSDISLTREQLSDLKSVKGKADVRTVTTSELTATFTGLAHNSTYYMNIGSECGGARGEWSNTMRFKTDCTHDVPLPFSEDFSSNLHSGESINPDCWTSYYNGMDVNITYPHVDPDGRSGKSVKLQVNRETDSLLLIAPELEVDDLSGCQVTFYLKPGSSSGIGGGVIVGLVADASTESAAWASFTPVDTFSTTKSWDKHIVQFTGCKDKGGRVAFTTTKALCEKDLWSDHHIKIDDIDIEVIPTCPRPDMFAVDKFSDSSIDISFEESGSAQKWQLQYGEKGFALGTGTTVELSSTGHSLTGLDPDTGYDIYVRAVCAEGDTSRWTAPVTAHTTPVAITVENSLMIDFEDTEDNREWIFVDETSVNRWHIGEAYKKGGDRALYISKDGGATAEYDPNAATVAWAYRYINLAPGIYTFSYDWVCYGDYNADYMKMTLTPSTATISSGEMSITYADGNIDFPSTYDDDYHHSLSLLPVGLDAQHHASDWQHAEKTLFVREDIAGSYMLLVRFHCDRSGSDMPNPSAVVDNLNIGYSPLFYPDSITADDITDKGATLSWVNIITPDHYEIAVMDSMVSPDDPAAGGHSSYTGTAGGSSVVLDRLESGSPYWVYMRAVSADGASGPWSQPLSIRTDCSVYQTGHLFTFDDGASYIPTWGKKRIAPVCFVSGHEKFHDKYVSGYPELVQSDDFAIYSRSGEYAIQIDAYGKNAYGGYLVMPKIYGDLDTMQVTFYMRPTYCYTKSGEMFRLNELRDGRTITVGTMTDPGDLSTFVKIKDVVYPWSQYPEVDPNNDMWWYRASVQLSGGTDKYIAFMIDHYDANENTMYLDDICVESTRGCVIPANIVVDSIGDVAARLTFNHSEGEAWEVHVSGNVAMDDTVWIDTVHTGVAVLRNLTPVSDMFVRVRQLCGDDKYSDWSQVKEFRTTYTLRFLEEFGERTRVPKDWMICNTALAFDLEELFSGEYIFEHSDYTYQRKDGWGYTDLEVGLKGSHMLCKHVSSFFLVTPQIHIENTGHAHLTLDLALTKGGSSAPIDIAEAGEKSAMFAVLVSGDGGRTWKEEDMTLWDNLGTGDHVFDRIPATGKNYRIDLSAYSGKTVRIALYACYRRLGTEIDLHVDNFRISNFHLSDIADNICGGRDYFGNGFAILNGDIPEGGGKFGRIVYVKENIPDTLYSLSLSASPMAEKLIEAEICGGDTYSLHGFSASATGIHKRKHSSANGCDSVTTLDLTVVDIPEVTVYDTICQGGKVIWHGKEYRRTGTYTDTLQMTGACRCDSIVTLALHVTGAQVKAEEITLCSGDSIEIGTLGFIRTSGLWRDTVPTPSGCDSVIEVDLTVLPELVTVIDTAICLGEEYDDGNFIGIDKTGTYDITVESADKCDSTLILNLIVLNPYSAVKVERSVSREELPFKFHGLTFGKETKDGTYTEKLTVTADGCSGEVELTLHVGSTSDINRVSSDGALHIAPNPVRVGGSVTIGIGLSPRERAGATLSVYSSAGALVRTGNIPAEGDIDITCYFSPGVYIVHITCSDGRTHRGKLIVR